MLSSHWCHSISCLPSIVWYRTFSDPFEKFQNSWCLIQRGANYTVPSFELQWTFTAVTLWTPLEFVLRIIQRYWYGSTWLLLQDSYNSIFIGWLAIQTSPFYYWKLYISYLVPEFNVSISSDFDFNKKIWFLSTQNIQIVDKCWSHVSSISFYFISFTSLFQILYHFLFFLFFFTNSKCLFSLFQ